jgi:gliding motility-associated-like protein
MKKIVLVLALIFTSIFSYSQSGASITSQPKSIAVCDGQSATLSITATGFGTIFYRWQFFDPFKGFNDISTTDPKYSGVTTSTLSFNTAGNFGAGTYRCRTTIDYDVFSNSATVTISPIPTSPTTTGDAGCGTTTVNLKASGMFPTGAAAKDGDFRWYSLASGGSSLASTSTYSPTITTTTTFYVSISNGSCESPRNSVVATSNPYPPATITTGSSACGPQANILLGASGGTNGQYRWYLVPSRGTAIAGEVNNSFTAKSLTATTTYYVSLNNGLCEGNRTPVVATIIPAPMAPEGIGAIACSGTSATLKAIGGANGEYRWYANSKGGSAIAGETNSTYQTPNLTAITTYYVSIVSNGCESSRSLVTATINTGCIPPTIDSKPLATPIGGKILLDLVPLIKTAANTVLDTASIKLITKPSSGGVASISSKGILTIDYKGIKFSGFDNLIIQACDKTGSCAQQTFKIEVAGDVLVFNAVSPDGNGKNDFFRLEYIDVLSPKNQVSIYNRWGDEVSFITDYNNDTRKFAGLTTDGTKLPSGTYFYKIALLATGEIKTGYLELKY